MVSLGSAHTVGGGSRGAMVGNSHSASVNSMASHLSAPSGLIPNGMGPRKENTGLGAAGEELPSGWCIAHTESGEPYYFNEVSGDTTWDFPQEELEGKQENCPSSHTSGLEDDKAVEGCNQSREVTAIVDPNPCTSCTSSPINMSFGRRSPRKKVVHLPHHCQPAGQAGQTNQTSKLQVYKERQNTTSKARPRKNSERRCTWNTTFGGKSKACTSSYTIVGSRDSAQAHLVLG